ncbi:MAG TPA: polysaccharide biosynthesis tyrosine autokinase [Nitrospiria bacterium]|nr:polysaccharide biosynthesis tyrosine autokinase [Nitrospiria bacterium]
MIQESEVHLHDYLRVLQKRRWTAITFFVILVTVVAVATFTIRPVYRSTVQILIERENPNVVSIQEVLAIDATATDYYQTQYEILKSETLARRVIARLKLDRDPDFQSGAAHSEDATGPDSEEKARGLLKTFLSRLTVSPIRNSRLVNVAFDSHDPVLSALVANTLADEYIQYNMELKIKAVQDASNWLRKRVDEMQVKVQQSEEAFEKFKESIPTQITAQVESKAESAEAMKEMESRPEVVNNKFIQDLRTEEIRLTAKQSELSKKYGPKHPQMIQVTSELATLRDKMEREIKRLVGAVKIEESSQYLYLKREEDANRQLYEVLLKRLKETALTENLPRSNIQVVDAAQPVTIPIKPKKAMNMILAVVLGLVLGSGLAFFFEYLDNTIKSPEDIERVIGAPLLGIVPSAGRARKTTGPSGKPSHPIETVLSAEPKSSYAEAYRTIRTGVLLSSAERPPKVVLVTSPGPVEGKTTTAANLAIAMAQAGSSTLLIDADLRRPRVHQLFARENPGGDSEADWNGNVKGLGPVLVGEATAEAAIRQTPIPLLSVLTSGPIPPNPAELLGSHRMRDLIAELGRKFDRIIIDSPPLVPVTDATLLSTICDGVVLVVKDSRTTKLLATEGRKRLTEAKAKLLGVVFNDVDLKKDSYRYYPYHSYYGKEEKSHKRKSART